MDEPPVDDKARILEQVNRAFAKGVPHNAAMGLEVLDFGDGFAVCRLPYDAKLVGNPETGVLHGGAITSMMDAACGAAVFMKLREARRIATLDLRIDYLRLATPGLAVVSRTTCYKVTRHVAFVRGLAYHGDDESDPIASAAGTFMVFRDAQQSDLARRIHGSEQ